MADKQSKKNAPKAGATAEGADIARLESTAMAAAYPMAPPPFKRVVVEASGPAGSIVAIGQVAKALDALVEKGSGGVTALEVSSWAYRLGAYVHTLRHDYGLTIETEREEHGGGWHARYRLVSPVSITRRLA